MTILWNEVTTWWNEVTKGWNEVVWNEVVMERSDRIPVGASHKDLALAGNYENIFPKGCLEGLRT